MNVDVPDGARWVVLHCTPAGEGTTVEARWDDATMDAATALAMVEAARGPITAQVTERVMARARAGLMLPLPGVDAAEETAPTTRSLGDSTADDALMAARADRRNRGKTSLTVT